MAKDSSFIDQIQEEEKKAAKMLEKIEKENNEKVAQAIMAGETTVHEADKAAREVAREKILGARDEAKAEYKKIMVDGDNARRDTIETGKTKLAKGQSYVVEAFTAMFD